MRYRYYGLLLFLLGVSLSSSAQQIQVQQDLGTWLGVKIEKELPHNFALSLEQQLRTRYNATKLDRYFAELGVQYDINENFRLTGILRYIHKKEMLEGVANQLRYNIDLQLRLPLSKKWRLSYRARYQQLFRDAFRMQRPSPLVRRNNAHRHRVKVRCKARKKHQCYALAELFVGSSTFREAYLDQLRLSIGDKIKTKVGAFNVALGYEYSLQPQEQFSFFFAKLIYELELCCPVNNWNCLCCWKSMAKHVC